MFLLGVESVVALGAGEAAFPCGIRPPRRRGPRALLLMGVQVRPPGEGGEALGAGKRPLARVTPDVIPQRHFGERPLAHGARVLGQRFGALLGLAPGAHGARVKGLVEDELRPGLGREIALPAPPLLAALRLRPRSLVVLLALVLPRVPRHVLRQGEQRAAFRTPGGVYYKNVYCKDLRMILKKISVTEGFENDWKLRKYIWKEN